MITKILIIIVIIMIVFMYIQYYSKYNKGYNITQTYLDKINIEHLYEKNPIVIYDKIKTPKQLLKTLFKYSYITSNEYTLKPNIIYMNKSKFSFIYSNSTSVNVNLINPIYKKDFVKNNNMWKTNNRITTINTMLKDTNVEYITIKLNPLQILIIPSHWMIHIDVIAKEDKINKVDLDDVFTYLYFSF